MTNKVIDNYGNEIDSAFSFGNDGDKSGLILESWGPSPRNPKYNDALECLIDRLKFLGIGFICIYIISKELLDAGWTQEQRTVRINNSDLINLNSSNTHDLRLDIGRIQAATKLDPSTTGGNRTKRILLYHPELTTEKWLVVATSPNSSQLVLTVRSDSTDDQTEYENRVDSILSATTQIEKPSGKAAPQKSIKTLEQFERDPKVKAWVLQQAEGYCEVCSSSAPFVKASGLPYLEVHHIRSLGDGGSDTVTNTVAVCPNCHRALHFSADRSNMIDNLHSSLNRLIRE